MGVLEIKLCVTLERLTLTYPTNYSLCFVFFFKDTSRAIGWGQGGRGGDILFIVATCGKMKRGNSMCDGGVTVGRAQCWRTE